LKEDRREKQDVPREGIHVGNRVDALALSDEPVFAFELDLEHVIEPASLVLVSLDGLLVCMRYSETEGGR
jgi:hypothetical protein